MRVICIWPYEFDEIYIGKDLIENKIIDQQTLSNNRSIQWKQITPTTFYLILLNITHTFYDGNGRTSKILSANDDIVRPNIWKNVNYI